MVKTVDAYTDDREQADALAQVGAVGQKLNELEVVAVDKRDQHLNERVKLRIV